MSWYRNASLSTVQVHLYIIGKMSNGDIIERDFNIPTTHPPHPAWWDAKIKAD